MSFKDLIYPQNLKYLNENTNLLNSEQRYRAFLTSGAFLYFFSIGCGITAQMLSFQRIFYTKDTFFFFGYYLFFLVGFLLSLGSFIYLSLSEKVFLKKKTLLFFVVGYLLIFASLSLFALLFSTFQLKPDGNFSFGPTNILTFIFDFLIFPFIFGWSFITRYSNGVKKPLKRMWEEREKAEITKLHSTYEENKDCTSKQLCEFEYSNFVNEKAAFYKGDKILYWCLCFIDFFIGFSELSLALIVLFGGFDAIHSIKDVSLFYSFWISLGFFFVLLILFSWLSISKKVFRSKKVLVRLILGYLFLFASDFMGALLIHELPIVNSEFRNFTFLLIFFFYQLLFSRPLYANISSTFFLFRLLRPIKKIREE